MISNKANTTRVGGNSSKKCIIPSSRILYIIDEYKPFIPEKYHYVFENFPSNDTVFVHYLIFAVWYCSRLDISINKLDLYSIFSCFKNIPFHSFLYYIRSHPEPDDSFVINI
jgi:hypothetical protein